MITKREHRVAVEISDLFTKKSQLQLYLDISRRFYRYSSVLVKRWTVNRNSQNHDLFNADCDYWPLIETLFVLING